MGKKVGSNRAGMFQPLRAPEAKAAARALYEATPGATCQTVADETKLPVGTIRRWKSEGEWKSAARTLPDLPGRAGALANTFKVRMSELGKPMSDEVAASEASKELSQEYAVDIRAAVLDRHRKEWAAPRKIAYEAMTKGDFDRAKLAKISAETLSLIQTGECRAYGLDHGARGADGNRTMVVIERGGDEQPEPQPELPQELVEPDRSTGTDIDGQEF